MLEVRFITNDNEIPKDYYYDTETSEFYCYRHRYTGHEIHIAKEPPLYVKAITFSEGETNGNMVKKMFPDFEVKELGDTVLLERYEPYCRMQFSREYWNAQYTN